MRLYLMFKSADLIPSYSMVHRSYKKVAFSNLVCSNFNEVQRELCRKARQRSERNLALSNFPGVWANALHVEPFVLYRQHRIAQDHRVSYDYEIFLLS
jgi:hypothetical protein